MEGEIMKNSLIVIFLLFSLCLNHANATFSGPYIVFTLETLDAGDVGEFPEVPGSLYLYPHVYSELDAGGTGACIRRLLDRLGSFKPKLYKGTELQGPL